MTFETVYSNDSAAMARAKVEGGWLYLHKTFEARSENGVEFTVTVSESMAFVPEKARPWEGGPR